MKHGSHIKSRGAGALLSAGLLFAMSFIAACKSALELTAVQAQTLIQAKYDQEPAAGAAITVNDLGMRQGVTAKYWDRSKAYPNNYWADFKLSPDGKKAVTLPGGGDTIQWRPDSPEDKRYSIVVTSVAVRWKPLAG